MIAPRIRAELKRHLKGESKIDVRRRQMQDRMNTVFERRLVQALWLALVSGLVSLAVATLAAG